MKNKMIIAVVVIIAIVGCGFVFANRHNAVNEQDSSSVAVTEAFSTSADNDSASDNVDDHSYEEIVYVEDSDTNIKDLYPLADDNDEAHAVIDPILEENETALVDRGVMLETAEKAVVRKDDENYIIFVNGMNITIDADARSISIADNDYYFGDGAEGADEQALYDSVSNVIAANTDILYEVNATFADLWHEVVYGDYGVRNTSDDGVYTIKYEDKIIRIDTINQTATVES